MKDNDRLIAQTVKLNSTMETIANQLMRINENLSFITEQKGKDY